MKTKLRRLGGAALAAACITAVSTPLLIADPAGAAVQCAGTNATIVGSAGPDTLNGTAGNDVIAGGSGNDTIYGLGGNDVICGDAGADTIDAGNAQDRVYGGPDSDTMSGGAGVDEVSYATLNTGIGVIVDLGSKSAAVSDGNDTLLQFENATGSPYGDQLYGTAQANQLAGLSGGDILVGYAGNDVLSDGGGKLSETNYFKGGAGDDIYYGGGAANDIADFWDPSGASGTGGVVVDLAGGFARNQGNDLLSGIDGVNGTTARDVIYGDLGNNMLFGDGGDDSLIGRGGNDTLQGWTGIDDLNGGPGDDIASFAYSSVNIVANLATGTATGQGNDRLVGIEGLLGGRGNDTLSGDGDKNTIEGGDGNDAIDGQGGADFAAFDSATQSVTADLRAGTATGQGNDTLANIENLRGGESYDILRGNDSANTLVAGDYDELEGRGGPDTFDSSRPPGYVAAFLTYASAPGGVTVDVPNRRATGAAGNDELRFVPVLITGSNFDDRLLCSTSPNDGTCNVVGRGGNDTITGTPGGDDVLTGGLGDDNIDGKGGINLANYEDGPAVNVNLPTGKATGQGNDTLTSISRVIGTSGNDTIVGNGGLGCILYGRAGDDNISSAGNGCELQGGNGSDTITGTGGTDAIDPDDNAAGNDTVLAGAGDDRIIGDDGNDNIDGGPGVDLLRYDGTSNPLQADLAAGVVTGAGNDTTAGIENFIGTAAKDTIRGTDGPNNIDGREGNDTIFGGDGDDILNAGTGDDWMDGNRGNDTMVPMQGNDMMYGEDGIDTVSFATAGVPVTVLMSSSQANGDGYDRFITVENVTGSDTNDTIIGDAGPNVIDGRGGADYCDGGGGGDTLLNCP